MIFDIVKFSVTIGCILFLGLFAIIMINRSIIRKNQTMIDNMIRDTDYDEAKIIAHLDYIINDAVDRYILQNIAPRNIYIINDKIQEEITEYATAEVSNRLSKTQRVQLSMICNDDYLGTFIGNEIYYTVTNRVLEFNINGDYTVPGNITGNIKT